MRASTERGGVLCGFQMRLLMWCVLTVGLVGAHCRSWQQKQEPRQRGWQPKTPRHGGSKRDAEADKYSEKNAAAFFDRIDLLSGEHDNKFVLAEWAYESNITDYNLQQKVILRIKNLITKFAGFQKKIL